MGKRSEHAPGSFSWVHVTTQDVAAAVDFYGALFGWTVDDPAQPYTTFRLDGDAVAGLALCPEGSQPPGAAPFWTSHVTVADVDATVARAIELGGTAPEPGFDVPEAGRSGVVKDPFGAEVALWSPDGVIGAERVNDVGCLCMNELAATDLDAALVFYGDLFGWTSEVVASGPDGPTQVLLHNDGRLNASASPADGGEAAHWRPYFTVPSAADAVARVVELGGQVALEPIEIPDGHIAIVLDAQGGELALFEGETDP